MWTRTSHMYQQWANPFVTYPCNVVLLRVEDNLNRCRVSGQPRSCRTFTYGQQCLLVEVKQRYIVRVRRACSGNHNYVCLVSSLSALRLKSRFEWCPLPWPTAVVSMQAMQPLAALYLRPVAFHRLLHVSGKYMSDPHVGLHTNFPLPPKYTISLKNSRYFLLQTK